jgi:hypothetical protein
VPLPLAPHPRPLSILERGDHKPQNSTKSQIKHPLPLSSMERGLGGEETQKNIAKFFNKIFYKNVILPKEFKPPIKIGKKWILYKKSNCLLKIIIFFFQY